MTECVYVCKEIAIPKTKATTSTETLEYPQWLIKNESANKLKEN